MKAMLLAAAIAVAIAGPAFARSSHVKHPTRHVLDAQAAVPDQYDVYVDGHYVGRDPDPNIRQSLRDQYYSRQGE
jgi:hypothetical protein